MNWLKTERSLFKKVEFNNQTHLAETLVEIARISDKINHHADMTIRYNQLDITLTTHDKGGLSNKDFVLSERIDEVLKKASVL